ncbi:Transposase [Levilactobacillus brevis]|uniref:Transposase n=1 Tax=Levilactobacillus brevis TaxID=1580 RepID=A0A5B7Y365_LEVBR|nr:Transposase [Levilactobacillus brevis]
MNYKALETSKTQWSSHLKDRMAQEQVIREGLELSEQFTQTYYSTHRLVRAFQKRNYQAFLEFLSKVENVSPQLS